MSNKGYAFFEYADPTVTDVCIAALHGFQVLLTTCYYFYFLLPTTISQFLAPITGSPSS